MSDSEAKDIVHVGTTSGVLTTPPWLTSKSVQLTRELVAVCNDDPRINDEMMRNSWSMPNAIYVVWLKGMLAYYPPARAALSFDHRAGAKELLGLIQGLPLLRRRLPPMDDHQVLSLLVNSFALLRGNSRSRQNYFYIGMDEITLRDDDLAVALCSTAPDDLKQSVATLAAMVDGRKSESMRAPEIIAALRGDQATALSQGAL